MKISLSDTSQLGKVISKLTSLAEVLLPGAEGEEKKQFVVGWINDHVDIPFLSETQEEAIISAIIDAVVGVIKG